MRWLVLMKQAVWFASAFLMLSNTVLHAQNQNVELIGQLDVRSYNEPIYEETWGVGVAGNTAYVWNFGMVGEYEDTYGALRIVDISNPAAPVLRGGYTMSGGVQYGFGVAVSGNLAYVAQGFAGLQITDISNPATPVYLGGYDPARSSTYACNVAVVGSLAYVVEVDLPSMTSQTITYSTLRIVDISNPSAPVPLGSYDMVGRHPWQVIDVAVRGNLVYVADGFNGLQIIDVSNPASPVHVGGLDTPYYACDVAVVDNMAYVMNLDIDARYGDTVHGGLRMVDISDPANPALRGEYELVSTYVWRDYKVAISENLAYITRDSDGLEIVDVSNPSKPIRLGGYEASSFDVAGGGNLAYVATGSSNFVILRYTGRMPTLQPIYRIVGAGDRFFDPTVDGYRFVNWSYPPEDLANDLLSLLDSELSGSTAAEKALFILSIPLMMHFSADGHCFGMAATSTLYFYQPLLKPSSQLGIETYLMPQENLQVTENIRKYHARQLPFNIVVSLNRNPSAEASYSDIETLVRTNAAPIVNLWDILDSKVNGMHTITAYAVRYDGSKRFIDVYDNNAPGVADHIEYDTVTRAFNYHGFHYMAGFSALLTLSPEDIARAIRNAIYLLLDQLAQEGQSVVALVPHTLASPKSPEQLSLDASPDFYVVDPLGKKAGVVQGNTLNEIEGSSQTLTQAIRFIYVPSTGSYVVYLAQGVEDSYDVYALDFVSGTLKNLIVFDQIQIGTQDSMQFELNQGEDGYVGMVDRGMDGSIDETLYPVERHLRKPGDANGDGVVNVADLVTITNCIHGTSHLDADSAMAADLNLDASVTLLDLRALEDLLLGR